MEEVVTGHISVPKGQATLLFYSVQGVGGGLGFSRSHGGFDDSHLG